MIDYWCALCREMRRCRLVDGQYSAPLLVLRRLLDLRLSTGLRPLADLLVRQPQWLPEEVTAASGLEVVGLSFLGPFLAPSVFPEEDPGVAEKYFKATLYIHYHHINREKY